MNAGEGLMKTGLLKGYTPRQLVNRIAQEAEVRLDSGFVHSMPAVVDVVLTKACNLACTFCKDYDNDGPQNVSEENLTRVAQQLFPTARRLSICSGGEPYLHRGLEHILRLAKQYNLYTWVLSNGMLLKEERMRTIIREGLITEHGFSVDGLQPETVENIRVFAKLPRILENIQMVQRIRDEEGKQFPTITIRYALMRSNIEELPAAIDYWGKNGANHLITGYLSIANNIPKEQALFYHQDLVASVFAEARKVAARYPAMKVTFPKLVSEEVERQKNPTRCEAPWKFVMINPNGEILPCYRSFEAMNMGSLYGDDARQFKDIWNSEPYQALRRTVNNDAAPKHFAYCSKCELRYGWGYEEAHLGDVTWKQMMAEQKPELVNIDHRRIRK
jgi:radical SAM protein with 4Fe4S-binding SPASM domain